MAKGRKATPAQIKILEGNPGKREVKEPKEVSGFPACPNWLLPEAKKEWRRMKKFIEPLGLVDETNKASFEGYCQSYARWREAEGHITKFGMTAETDSGGLKTRPEVAIADKNKTAMLKFAAEFGLTPSARNRIAELNKDSNDIDPMEELL